MSETKYCSSWSKIPYLWIHEHSKHRLLLKYIDGIGIVETFLFQKRNWGDKGVSGEFESSKANSFRLQCLGPISVALGSALLTHRSALHIHDYSISLCFCTRALLYASFFPCLKGSMYLLLSSSISPFLGCRILEVQQPYFTPSCVFPLWFRLTVFLLIQHSLKLCRCLVHVTRIHTMRQKGPPYIFPV